MRAYKPPVFYILILLEVVLITVSMMGCKPDYLSEEELQAYILDQDNHLSKSRDYRGFRVQVTYRPADLLILQETGSKATVDSADFKRLSAKYSDQYYFILNLSKAEKEALYQVGGGQGRFGELVQVLSFRMGQYVNLTTSSQDTIPVADYVYPRTYNMGGATTLMFVFKKEKIRGDERLQFNLKEFGMGLGNQNFRFRIEDLENAPQVEFEVKHKLTTQDS